VTQTTERRYASTNVMWSLLYSFIPYVLVISIQIQRVPQMVEGKEAEFAFWFQWCKLAEAE